MSGNHHGRDKRKEFPTARPAVARPATPVAYDDGPFLTFTTKLGLVLIVVLSIGLSALIALAPEPKQKDEAVAKVEDKADGEKKPEKPEEMGDKKPAEKDPTEKKPAEKKPPEKKEPTEKKPPEKKPPEKEPMKKPADKEKKPAEKDKDKEKMTPDKDKDKKPEEKKPPEKKPPEKGTEVVFEKQVLPIFTAKCGMCHGVSGKAGVDLRTMKAIVKGGGNGPILTKGDLKKSLLWEVIDTDQMPQSDEKLSAEEKDVIKKWILGGAKEMAAK